VGRDKGLVKPTRPSEEGGILYGLRRADRERCMRGARVVKEPELKGPRETFHTGLPSTSGTPDPGAG